MRNDKKLNFPKAPSHQVIRGEFPPKPLNALTATTLEQKAIVLRNSILARKQQEKKIIQRKIQKIKKEQQLNRGKKIPTPLVLKRKKSEIKNEPETIRLITSIKKANDDRNNSKNKKLQDSSKQNKKLNIIEEKLKNTLKNTESKTSNLKKEKEIIQQNLQKKSRKSNFNFSRFKKILDFKLFSRKKPINYDRTEIKRFLRTPSEFTNNNNNLPFILNKQNLSSNSQNSLSQRNNNLSSQSSNATERTVLQEMPNQSSLPISRQPISPKSTNNSSSQSSSATERTVLQSMPNQSSLPNNNSSSQSSKSNNNSSSQSLNATERTVLQQMPNQLPQETSNTNQSPQQQSSQPQMLRRFISNNTRPEIPKNNQLSQETSSTNQSNNRSVNIGTTRVIRNNNSNESRFPISSLSSNLNNIPTQPTPPNPPPQPTSPNPPPRQLPQPTPLNPPPPRPSVVIPNQPRNDKPRLIFTDKSKSGPKSPQQTEFEKLFEKYLLLQLALQQSKESEEITKKNIKKVDKLKTSIKNNASPKSIDKELDELEISITNRILINRDTDKINKEIEKIDIKLVRSKKSTKPKKRKKQMELDKLEEYAKTLKITNNKIFGKNLKIRKDNLIENIENLINKDYLNNKGKIKKTITNNQLKKDILWKYILYIRFHNKKLKIFKTLGAGNPRPSKMFLMLKIETGTGDTFSVTKDDLRQFIKLIFKNKNLKLPFLKELN
jgi:hypothetical protein